MPVTRRRSINFNQPTELSKENAAKTEALTAAINTPTRKRKHSKNIGRIEAFLTTWEYAPIHLQDNEYILRGYRVGHNFKDAIKSALRIHNETGNIWTHLVGFVIFVFLTVATISLRPAPLRLGAEAIATVEQRLYDYGKTNLYDLIASAEAWERSVRKYSSDKMHAIEETLRSIGQHNLAELGDTMAHSARDVGKKIKKYGATGIAELVHLEERLANFSSDAVHDIDTMVHRALASILNVTWPVSRWPMHVFTTGAMICLLTSSLCHLFGCCSAHISAIMWRFDYAGIAVLIVASFYPPVYYGFLCKPLLRMTYLVVTTLLGASTLSVTLLERFQDPKYHEWRAALFVGLGMWGVVPLMHGWMLYADVAAFSKAVHLDLLMGAIYLLGAGIYATKVPERWKPGAFDVAFHSHQLFHVTVVVAAVVHYKASRQLMEWRDMTGGCMSSSS